ncbi:Na+/H+ antiporter NhaC, partial [Subdoligranulum sp. OF01-18]
MKQTQRTEKKAEFLPSLLVMVAAILVLVGGILVLKLDPHIPLIMCTFVLVFYGLYLGISWSDMMSSAVKSISECIEAIIIMMSIGMVVGAWIAGGTVPFIIYWGLKIFSPQWLLPFTVVLCALMSTLIGSSWTTAGTIGVAFMGIGMGLGIPAPIVAGAVVCGSFFGDTQSPMSDGCNFATAISGAGLYNGVRGMIISNVPALLISIVAYVFIGMNYSHVSADSASGIAETLAGLEGAFNLTPAVLLPAALLIFLIVIKFPAVPTMIAAAFAGTLCAVLFQGEGLGAALGYMMKGYVGDTGVADVDKIVTRGGLSAMMSTVAIVILSMWMAGVLQRTGIMHAILAKIARIIRKPAGLVTTTTVMTYLFSYFAADPYLAMMLPSKAFAEAYDEMGYDRSVLCRSVSSAVFFAPMVPWGSGGLYVAATLGVAVLDYLPYYFVGFLAPIITILCAFTGWGMYKAKKAA